jgi:hypothetical protein
VLVGEALVKDGEKELDRKTGNLGLIVEWDDTLR